jgi:D-amino-acid dehydrogenase
MALAKADAIVLGAGIVGVSTALQLQAQGRDVAIVDRLGVVAGETSYGNTGIVQSEAVFPYMFPRDVGEIARAALNLDPRVQIRYSALPFIAPWLIRYFLASSERRTLASALAARPLLALCLSEHQAIATAADAMPLLRKTGWIKAFRTAAGHQEALAEIEQLRPFGIDMRLLDRAALVSLEPGLRDVAIGGLHFPEPWTTSDPGALTRSYAALFVQRGGRLLRGDAVTLAEASGGWSVKTADGSLFARDAVIALGPWSSDVFRLHGYALPLGVKRGYHMHYRAAGGAQLARPVLDSENGYVLTPMSRGIRQPRNSPDHRRRVRAAGRSAVDAPSRSPRAQGANACCAWRTGRGSAVARPQALPARHAASDWRSAAPQGPVVQLRAQSSRADARPGQRSPARRNDRGQGRVHRPGAIFGAAVRLA